MSAARFFGVFVFSLLLLTGPACTPNLKKFNSPDLSEKIRLELKVNQCVEAGKANQKLDMTVSNVSETPVIIDRHALFVYPEILDSADSIVQTPIIYENMYRIDTDLPQFITLQPAMSTHVLVELSHHVHYHLEAGKPYFIKGTYYRFGNSENKKRALQGICYSDFVEIKICD